MLDLFHMEVHNYAKSAAEAYKGGNIKNAEADLKLLEKASNEVIAKLESLITYLENDKVL